MRKVRTCYYSMRKMPLSSLPMFYSTQHHFIHLSHPPWLCRLALFRWFEFGYKRCRCGCPMHHFKTATVCQHDMKLAELYCVHCTTQQEWSTDEPNGSCIVIVVLVVVTLFLTQMRMETVFRGAKLCFPAAGLSHTGQTSPNLFFVVIHSTSQVLLILWVLSKPEGREVRRPFSLVFLCI